MTDNQLKYKIGIEMIPGIGSKNAKKLIAYCGSVEAVFKQTKKAILRIPGIGEVLATEISGNKVLDLAQREIEFIERYNIQPLYFLDPNYPERLRQCEDGPVVLFVKGSSHVEFNSRKFVSIVGTRKATDYGKKMCEALIAGLVAKGYNPVIVSGLAYGIDVTAHRLAIKNGLVTIAVLGHGLDKIYPANHRGVAKEIAATGALITDFPSATRIDRNNFIKRNRIIAGLSDVTIVVESGLEGGALITADMAQSYNRDVLAVPGNAGEKYSQGCNLLIKTNKAALVESVDDIEYHTGWESSKSQAPVQATLFPQLQPDEKKIVDLLKQNGQQSVDVIANCTGLSVSKVLALLLNLEFSGVVAGRPGKVFKLCSGA